MKIKWSAFYTLSMLLALAGCGSEQFGSSPKTTTESVSPLKSYSHNSCSTYTLIKPKVDVLYVVDNSSSSYYIASDVKTAISNTVNRLSSDFDFRVIGTPLLETNSGNNDYQVLTNSTDLQGLPSDARKISSSGGFSFFSNAPVPGGVEKGLGRIVSFVDAHKNSLIRSNAYLIIVLVSNGRDVEVEEDAGYGNGETRLNSANYNARLMSLRNLRGTAGLNALQLRLISVTAKSVCQSGWRSSNKSYVKMANQLFVDSGAVDDPTDNIIQDSADLCSSGTVSSIFNEINNSIKQVILPHSYRYWPITFGSDTMSVNDIKVTQIKPNGSTVELTKDMEWFYEDRGNIQSVNTRELPTVGEPINGRYFVRFANLVTYPDCVLITSVSRTEYFDYVVLPQKPIIATLSIRINGQVIPKSTTNGWSDETSVQQTINIKAPYPTAADENPPVMRTGFMIKLNGASNYYKSGDNVEVNYNPAGV